MAKAYLQGFARRAARRAASLDDTFGDGGRWYGDLTEGLVTRLRDKPEAGSAEYRHALRAALNRLRHAIAVTTSAPTHVAGRDLTADLPVSLRDARVRATVEAIKRYDVDTLLPPSDTPAGLRRGIHIPVKQYLYKRQHFVEDPHVAYNVLDGRLSLRGINEPTPSSTVEIDWKPNLSPHLASDVLGDDRTVAIGRPAPKRKRPYEAAELGYDGVDLYTRHRARLPQSTDRVAYRLPPRLEPEVADPLMRWHRRHQAAQRFGVVDREAISDAIELARRATPRADGISAAAMDDIAASVESAPGEPLVAGAVAEALENLAEDLGPGTPPGRPPGSAVLCDDEPSPDGAPRGKPSPPPQPGGPPPPPSPSEDTTDDLPDVEPRTLDVGIEGTLADRQIIVLAALGLVGDKAPDMERSTPFGVDPLQTVSLHLSCSGFEAIDDPVATVTVERGRRSANQAFRLRVRADGRHKVVVAARQGGYELARVVVEDFAASPPPVPLDVSTPAVDVLISVGPKGELSLTTQDAAHRNLRFNRPLPDNDEVRAMIDELVATFVEDATDDELAWDLERLGTGVARLLPPLLVKLLTEREDLTVLVDHPADRDFPFELALLERDDGDVFLGEAHRITRWISLAQRPRTSSHRVARAALISDGPSLEGAEAELVRHTEILTALCPTMSYDDLPTVRRQVFQTTEFGLVDIISHLEAQGPRAGLSFGDTYLPPMLTRKDRAFGRAAALVFVNACSSTRVTHPFLASTSFPNELIDQSVQSVVATVLPVEPHLALEFGTRFFAALGTGLQFGEALREARIAMVAASDNSGTGPDSRQRRRLAAVAYCGFGHPHLTVSFTPQEGAA